MIPPVNSRLLSKTPVRTIGMGYRGIRGEMTVCGKRLAYESSWERGFLTMLSVEPNVLDVRGQPCQIRVAKPPRAGTAPYTPDFFVHWGGRRERGVIYEIKPIEALRQNFANLKPAFIEMRRQARQEGYENPNAFSVGQVVCQAMLRKEAVLEALGLTGQWPVWGLIETVFVDNAMEFRSDTLRAACAQYGVGLEYRPPATPHYGGHIERLMGTLATALRNLPGATFSNPMERKHYDSLKEAALTLDEFEVWLVRWLIEYYNNNRIHSGLDTTPLAKWTAAIEGIGSLRPGSGHLEPIADETRMRIDFLPAKRREVERGQIRLHNIRYAGYELDRFNASDDKFTVRYDPRKLSPIWFWDPKAHHHIPLHYADLTLPVVSLWELIEIKKAARAKGSRALDSIALEQMVRANEHLVDTAKATTRTAQRARVRREATKRAEKLTPAQPHNARLPPPPAPTQIEDDDWTVPEDRPRTILLL